MPSSPLLLEGLAQIGAAPGSVQWIPVCPAMCIAMCIVTRAGVCTSTCQAQSFFSAY